MPVTSSPVRFGPFEVDLCSGEVRRNGTKVRLADQPLQVLTLLLEHSGEVVTREELRQRLWSSDTFVDFEHGLNAAVKRLREALGDTADNPQFIETLPRHGYRFIGALERPLKVKAKAQRFIWITVSLAIIVLSAFLLAWFVGIHRRPVLTEKDTVVVGDFANNTGDPVFTDSLRQGLLVELKQSPFLKILSDERVQTTLQEMERQPQEPLTDVLAREVCQRTQSKVFVAGSIASIGSQYVLSLRAVNCSTGDVVALEQTQVPKKEDILNALGNQGSQLRRKVGESLASIQKFDVPIMAATTSSLEALQAYSIGLRKKQQDSSEAAISSLIRATELDPNFATAYDELGTVYWNLEQDGLAEKNAEKAYQLRAKVTGRERIAIEAHYYDNVLGNLEKSRQVYELWKATYPQDYIPNNSLGVEYSMLRQYDLSLKERLEAIRKAPDVKQLYSNLAASYLHLGQLEEANRVVADAKKRGLTSEYLLLSSYAVAFARHDTAEMERIIESVSKSDLHLRLLIAQSDTEAYYGRLQKFLELNRQAAERTRRKGLTESSAFIIVSRALQQANFGNCQRRCKNPHFAEVKIPTSG